MEDREVLRSSPKHRLYMCGLITQITTHRCSGNNKIIPIRMGVFGYHVGTYSSCQTGM